MVTEITHMQLIQHIACFRSPYLWSRLLVYVRIAHLHARHCDVINNE